MSFPTNPGFFDYPTEVALGRSTTRKVIHKFGQNQAVGNTVEDVWITGGIYVWLTAAVTMEAISDDTNDDSDGTGARTIRLEGLDANWDEISETITMNGTSVTVATTQLFIRLNRAYVVTCGTYSSSNIGNITIRTSGAGATHAMIDVENSLGTGQTQLARYSVPRNNIIVIYSIHIWSDQTQPATIFLFKRENGDTVTAPFSARRLMFEVAGLTVPENIIIKTPIKLPSHTDVYFQVIAGAGSTDVAVDFEFIQVTG